MSEQRTIEQGRSAASPRWTRRLNAIGASSALRVALGLTSTVGIGGVAAMGCLDRPIETVEPRTTSTVVDILTQSSVDKIDVLLVIDNSGSMGDKQSILATAVPKLVERLVTPVCVSQDGGVPADPPKNVTAEGKCEDEGYEPEFKPVKDINIGIVSSSLGASGSSVCAAKPNSNNQDDAHLLARSVPGTSNNNLPTYEGLGFLAWDPDQKRLCPGEDAGGEKCVGSKDAGNLIETLTSMVQGVGEVGCGFEAPLEAAYRFLVDPKPVGNASPDVDQAVLDQRAAFLRPDSLLAVIVLTDENDCSFRADSIGSFGASPASGPGAPTDAHNMPLPRSECADNPDDACCTSCIFPIPDGCSGDGGCAEPGNQANPANYFPTGDKENNANIRCWDQKRRFGTDFLYPPERYVNAFSQPLINPKKLDLATGGDGSDGEQNPLFSDLQGLGRTIRSPDLVFFAGIVGVPWQLIARKNDKGDPDLREGVNATVPDSKPVGGFQSYDELEQSGAWKLLIGQGDGDLPDDPLMIESPDKRKGLSDEIDSNPINGNEWDTEFGDLQYACIFDLAEKDQRTCDPEAGTNCADCNAVDEAISPSGKPLCDPADLNHQIRAKAYPGTRILEVLNGLKNQGIPASICPAQLDENDSVAKDYGYTPAVFAIIDRLKTKLGGSCQPRQLVADADGNTPCIVIEARDSDGDKKASTTKSCAAACKQEGRAPIGKETQAAADKIQSDLDDEDTEQAKSFDCLCEIVQLQGDPDKKGSDRNLCQNEENPKSDVDGWCYVDATTVPPVGNPDLVSACPPTEQRLVRFVNQGEVSPGGRLYITCAGDAAGQKKKKTTPTE